MAIITLKCPNCGGDIEFIGSTTYGSCRYCGTRVLNEPNVSAMGNIGANAINSRFFVIFSYKGRETKHMADDELTFYGEYRKDAMYGDRNPMVLIASSKNNPLPLKINCDNISLDKTQLVYSGNRFLVNKGQKVKLFINDFEQSESSFEINFDDVMRIGDITISLQQI